jgi:hypothetical protein
MKKTVGLFFVAGVLAFAMVSMSIAAEADHMKEYESLAKKTVQAILGGSVRNVDKLIANQEKLMEIGLEECEEHKEEGGSDVKVMDLIIKHAPRMKTSTLEELEENWHDGAVLTANGIDFDALDPLAPTSILMHMVVHPASAYVALKEYKSSKDKDMLDVVKDELSEVLKHLEHVEEHVKEHEGH